jgi:metal-dependent amidase/aminoacylase/carboxypeptidase family protein
MYSYIRTACLFLCLSTLPVAITYLRMDGSSLTAILDKYRPNLAPYEDLYRHLHANPELSTQERETAQLIARRLSGLSSDLDIRTGIGGHGLVAILKNGAGKTVLLRADIDGLPVAEKTELPYASKKTMQDVDGIVKPVMHGKSLRGHA